MTRETHFQEALRERYCVRNPTVLGGKKPFCSLSMAYVCGKAMRIINFIDKKTLSIICRLSQESLILRMVWDLLS